jgi:ELWxxDGT repeat protein
VSRLLTAAVAAALTLGVPAASQARAYATPDSGDVPHRLAELARVGKGGSAGDQGVSFQGRFYFDGHSDAAGDELWVTDGTAAGTHELVDLLPGAEGSEPDNFVVFAGRVWFAAATPASGDEWYSTDGTAIGTGLALEIDPGTGSSSPRQATLAGGRLFFAADDGATGTALWRTDGTQAGTARLDGVASGPDSAGPEELTGLGDQVVFTADDAQGGHHLYAAGTGPADARRLDTGPAAGLTRASGLTRVGDRVWFAGVSAAGGVEPWSTGGLPESTAQVKDVVPGPGSSDPSELTDVGGRAYFAATTAAPGTELWSSDGSDHGTTQVADIRGGAAGSEPHDLRAFHDRLLFQADDGVHGVELWSSDGTEPGTHLVLDAIPGAAGAGVAAVRGTLDVGPLEVYPGQDAAGVEPWVTDGTEGGTHRVADLTTGPATSDPVPLGVLGSTVLLRASDQLSSSLVAWTAAGSVVSAHPKARYSARQGRHKKVVVPVSVTSTFGTALTGGVVVLSSHGRLVGSAPLVDGTARVRITRTLRAGRRRARRYAVTATWPGDVDATGSASVPVHVTIKKRKRHQLRRPGRRRASTAGAVRGCDDPGTGPATRTKDDSDAAS